MASNHTLDAQTRTVLGKKVKALRKQGLIPATVYGKGFEPASVQLDDRTFNAIYRKAGKTALIELKIADQKMQSVFVQSVQRHPITRSILHIDFKIVDLLKPVHMEVPLTLVGESPLVARGDAMINHVINTLLVEALPASLPQHIEVDVSGLDELDKTISVADLSGGQGYTILTDAEQVLISLSQTRAAAEEEPAEEVSVEPELVRKERESDEGEGE